MLGVLARHDGDLDTALIELERSLALAEELGDDPAVVAALNNLALVRRERGELRRRARADRAAHWLFAPLTAIATAKPLSRTTWPTSTTRPGVRRIRWLTSNEP